MVVQRDRPFSAAIFAATLFFSSPASTWADEVEKAESEIPAEEAPQKTEAPKKKIGLNLDLGYATHYVFRGLNLFADDSQLDPHMLLAPGMAWSVFDTGVTVGWWSALQISGNNIRAKIDEGVGVEQDLYVSYEHEFAHALTLGGALYWYFYPAAKEEASGAAFPNWLEPSVSLLWAGPVELGLTLTYMIGVPPGFSRFNYVYFMPFVGRTFDFNELLSLKLNGSFGYKLFTEDPGTISDNMFDITVTTTLSFALGEYPYLSFGVGFAWTNRKGEEGENPGFAEELAFWGALNVGADF